LRADRRMAAALPRARPRARGPARAARAEGRDDDLRRLRALPLGAALARRADLEGPEDLATFERDTRGFAVPGRGRHAFRAQLVLQHAPDRVAGQVVAELDVTRDRKERHALRSPAAELLLGELGFGLQHRGDLHL